MISKSSKAAVRANNQVQMRTALAAASKRRRSSARGWAPVTLVVAPAQVTAVAVGSATGGDAVWIAATGSADVALPGAAAGVGATTPALVPGFDAGNCPYEAPPAAFTAPLAETDGDAAGVARRPI